tara:strand:+ start:109 stop:855 length:747 start_codon:yes stop_codon:yes gene_type:complete
MIKKVIISIILYFSLVGNIYAKHQCITYLEDSEGKLVPMDLRKLEGVSCSGGLKYDKSHCSCGDKESYSSKKVEKLYKGPITDLRKYSQFILDKDRDDYFYLNILSFNLLDHEFITKRQLKNILNYKRKKSDNLKDTKLLCGSSPYFYRNDKLVMVALEFKSKNNFLGYGFDSDDWYDIEGKYEKTKNNIELDYKILTNGREDSESIDRKTLKMDYGIQCSIFNHNFNIKKIVKKVYSLNLDNSENKL